MTGRQKRVTSRAQASCPTCWAEPPAAIRKRARTKRSRPIRDTPGQIQRRAYLRCAHPRGNAAVRRKVAGGRRRLSGAPPRSIRNQLDAATLPLAAASRSMIARQPEDSSVRCLNMQAVIAGMLGISELQNLKASPVHICCASLLKAKPGCEHSADIEMATASAAPAL